MRDLVLSANSCRRSAILMAAGCFVGAASLLLCRDFSAVAANRIPTVHLSFDPLIAQRQIGVSDTLGYLPNSEDVGLSRIDAFENHEYFVYLRGAARASRPIETTAAANGEIEVIRQVLFVRPHTFLVDDQLKAGSLEAAIEAGVTPQISTGNRLDGDTETSIQFVSRCLLRNQTAAAVPRQIGTLSSNPKWIRTLHVVRLKTDSATLLPACEVEPRTGTARIEVNGAEDGTVAGTIVRLWLPIGSECGHLEIAGNVGGNGRVRRLLPSGILSPEPDAATRRLQWDLPYQAKGSGVWDIQHPSSELRRAVESSELAPCRVVEFGCGTGNDAIYLASQGFDVTAIDISPTALAIAERKAEKARVSVEWLLADILQPPICGPFDLVYDRGCYHEVRQRHAVEYVNAVRKLTRTGAKVFILAGNANDDPEWKFEGPARVREADIRRDFSAGFRLQRLSEFRFDAAPAQQRGALAWSVLVERLSNSSSQPR